MRRYLVLCTAFSLLMLASCAAFTPRITQEDFYKFERTINFSELVKGNGPNVIVIFRSGKISGLNHRDPVDFKEGDEIVWNSAKVGWGAKSTARRAMTIEKTGKLFTGINIPDEDTGYFSLHRKAENDYLSFRMTEWKYSSNVTIDRKKWLLSYKIK